MFEEVSSTASKFKSCFGVLVLLQVASVVLIGILLSTDNLQPPLQTGLLIFFCSLLLILIVLMIVLLIYRPQLLFTESLSDLKDEQGRLTHVASELGNKLVTTEQALIPILTENDPDSISRIESRRIIIGSKDFAEQLIFGYLLAYWLEVSLPEIKVDRRIPNGSTMKNFAELKNGWIDGYVEYTGTGCMLLQVDERKDSVEKTIDELNKRSEKRFGIVWLGRLGTTNDYKVVVNKSLAKKMGKEDNKKLRIVDIRKAVRGTTKLSICGQPETMNRPDAWVGLKREYSLNYLDVKIVGYSDRYEALRSGYADATIGFETDPEIEDTDFVVLEDSRGFFPRYHAVPLFRAEALREIPRLREALEQLENKLVQRRVMDMITDYKARGSDPGVARDIAMKYVDEILTKSKQPASG